MKEEKDYIKEISEIRSMMERSSKFLSLSGWAGIVVGLYALVGAWFAQQLFYAEVNLSSGEALTSEGLGTRLQQLIFLALGILFFSIATAYLLSHQKAKKRSEKIWNYTSKRLLANMAVPLVAGGILIVILLCRDFVGLMAPLSLIFYGLAVYSAGKFTYHEVKILGIVQIALGLFSAYFIEYGLLCWALGFGVAHIIYGVYLHIKYER